MITSDRHCDGCDNRALCQATGDMRWYCRGCFESRTGVPWDGRRTVARPVRKSYRGNAPVSGAAPPRTDRRERERDARRNQS